MIAILKSIKINPLFLGGVGNGDRVKDDTQ